MGGLVGERYDDLLRPVADRRVVSGQEVRPRGLLSTALDTDEIKVEMEERRIASCRLSSRRKSCLSLSANPSHCTVVSN